MINEGWAVVVVIGVWGWIMAGVGFVLQAFPARNRINGRSATVWGGCFIFFYFLWVTGMINA
jgi:hypothetical protein